MKKIALLLLAGLLFAMSSCKEDDETTSPIVVPENQNTNQTVYADNTSGQSGVKFTTAGPWTSSISPTTKSNAASWVSISPSSGDKAGNYTIAISLSPNTTGSDRAATITILCEGSEITINVSQKGTKEDGTKPEMNVVLTGLDNDNVISLQANEGYTQAPVRTITIANKGNVPTGDLTLATEDVKNAYTLSTNTIKSIAVGDSATFTISPKTGLKAGEGNAENGSIYSAHVSIKNSAIDKSFSAYFKVLQANRYEIILDAENIAFQASEGYTIIPSDTVVVTNSGTAPTGEIALRLANDTKGAFKLSKTTIASLAPGEKATFVISAKTGLKAGEGNSSDGKVYEAKVILENDHVSAGMAVSLWLSPAATASIAFNGLDEETGTGGAIKIYANEGYSADSCKRTITIANIGSVSTGDISLSFENRDTTFILSKTIVPNIAVGGSATFTITPSRGLKAGKGNADGGDTYYAKLLLDNKDIEKEIEVYFNLK